MPDLQNPQDYAIFCCIVVYHVHFHQGNPQEGDGTQCEGKADDPENS